ncbi:hypothetical protein QJS04_geneDACA016593 [Acorus gramineus]|uniref:Uncharacterized protein n=1 Tax=Acorus gramineus TaxID=55184 RepID=A0AAV9BPV6_ACOGR|nr:hypothetical protein QJS04_geneDACA016593 [Acorus gramineus]
MEGKSTSTEGLKKQVMLAPYMAILAAVIAIFSGGMILYRGGEDGITALLREVV